MDGIGLRFVTGMKVHLQKASHAGEVFHTYQLPIMLSFGLFPPTYDTSCL
jgi:hypothetical protein